MKNDALQDLFAVDPEIIYLNHAAVAPWPVPVQEAVCRFARENAHAGSRHYPRWLATEQRLRERAARLLDMSVAEVRNRATITGAIEIGRHPGVVQVTFLAPLSKLEAAGLLPFVREQYGIG